MFFIPYSSFYVYNFLWRIKLLYFIELLEKELNLKAQKSFKPFQKGDVKVTSADTKKIENFINFRPNTPIEIGVKKFVKWYKEYYKI